ncbi:hypothetical protein ON010_g8400 [Phytophthora cinnamomi]|nr:hypothetical protein ON010_g8400 [Phytophthora cinnamomi]
MKCLTTKSPFRQIDLIISGKNVISSHQESGLRPRLKIGFVGSYKLISSNHGHNEEVPVGRWLERRLGQGAGTTKSRETIDLKARIKRKQLYRLCGDVVKDVIDVVLATIYVDDGKSSRPPRATAKYYRTFTWKERSAAIFYYLRPLLGNMDAEITCRVFGVRYPTSSNWTTNASYYPKWIPFLENMTVRSVQPSIPTEFASRMNLRELELESGVQIPIRLRSPTTKRFITATSEANLSRQKSTNH